MLERHKLVHYSFLTGIGGKGINAVAEIVGAILLFFLSADKVVNFLISLTTDELDEDPRDLVANFLLKTAHSLSVDNLHFAAIYLFIHGVIKMLLIIALVKRKAWAYPVAMAVFSLFIIYQLYKFYFNHSWWLVAISFFDLTVIALTWLEYKRILEVAQRPILK